MLNESGLDYLIQLIKYYSIRVKELFEIKDLSCTVYIDYLATQKALLELKLLYFKLTNKEYKE